MKPSATSSAGQTAQPSSIPWYCVTSLLACVVLSACQFGPRDDQIFQPVPESKPQAVAPQPSAAALVSPDAQDKPASAEVIAPQSTLAKATTQTTGLTLVKRQMATLTGDMPVNTNGYRLEKIPSLSGTNWTVLSIFMTNKFVYRDLFLTNPIWFYRAVAITPPAIKPHMPLVWDQVTGATNYSVKQSLAKGGPYTASLSTKAQSVSVTNLVSGRTYYFVVTASNGSGESVPSNEVVYLVP